MFAYMKIENMPTRELREMLAVLERAAGFDSQSAQILRRELDGRVSPHALKERTVDAALLQRAQLKGGETDE